MSELYPLLLKPQFVERIWGSRDLSPLFGPPPGVAPIGEVWLTGDDCRVANGPLAGASLGELCRRFGRDLVGETASETDRFPLLVKFLFPHDKLSVQVHPDDECAQRVGQPWGKTECWYVLHAEKGAQVALGMKPGTTRRQLEQAISETRAEDLLNWIDIHTGEMIYVAGGTVHAIAPGSILVETQQSSDTTYRLYDYGRPRPLHLEQGMEAVKEKTGSGKVRNVGGNGQQRREQQELIASPFFVVEKFALKEPSLFTTVEAGRRLVQILVVVNGCGVIEESGSQPVTFAPGEAVVVPACVEEFRVRPQWSVEFLRARVPAYARPEPAVI